MPIKVSPTVGIELTGFIPAYPASSHPRIRK
jgi:hypothetical protein